MDRAGLSAEGGVSMTAGTRDGSKSGRNTVVVRAESQCETLVRETLELTRFCPSVDDLGAGVDRLIGAMKFH